MNTTSSIYTPGQSSAWRPSKVQSSLMDPNRSGKLKNFAMMKFNAGFIPAFFLPPQTNATVRRNGHTMPRQSRLYSRLPNDYGANDPESVRMAIDHAIHVAHYASCGKRVFSYCIEQSDKLRSYTFMNTVLRAGAPVLSSGELDPAFKDATANRPDYFGNAAKALIAGYTCSDLELDMYYSRGLPATLDRIVPYAIKGLFPFECTKDQRSGLTCLRKGLPYVTEWRAFDGPTVRKVSGINLINNFAVSKYGHKVLSSAIQYIFGTSDETYQFIKAMLINNIGFKYSSNQRSTRNIYQNVMSPRFPGSLTGDQQEDPGVSPWDYECFINRHLTSPEDGVYRSPTPGVYTSRSNNGVRYNSLAGFGRVYTHLAQPLLKYNNTGVLEYLGFIQLIRMYSQLPVRYKDTLTVQGLKDVFKGIKWYPNIHIYSKREYVMRMRLRLLYLQMYCETFNELPPEEIMDNMKLSVDSGWFKETKISLLDLILEERWDFHWRTQFGLIHLENDLDTGVGNTEFAANLIHVLLLLQFESSPRVISYLFNYLLYNVSLCDNRESLRKVTDVWTWLKTTPYWNSYARTRILERAKKITRYNVTENMDKVFAQSCWSSAASRNTARSFVIGNIERPDEVERAKKLVMEITKSYANATKTLEELRDRLDLVKQKLRVMPNYDYRVGDLVKTVRADGSIIDADEQKAMYEFIRDNGFEFLGDAPDEFADGNYIGAYAKKAMLLIDNLMPINALYLVARNAKDIMHLSMLTTMWSGFNHAKIESNSQLNGGIMPLAHHGVLRHHECNPLPVLDVLFKFNNGFKNLGMLDAIDGIPDSNTAYLPELFSNKLHTLIKIVMMLTEDNLAMTCNTAIREHLIQKYLGNIGFNASEVTAVLRRKVLKEDYSCITNLRAKQPHVDNTKVSVMSFALNNDLAMMQTRLIAVGLFGHMDAYRESVQKDEVAARTRLRTLALHPDLRDLLQYISDGQLMSDHD